METSPPVHEPSATDAQLTRPCVHPRGLQVALVAYPALALDPSGGPRAAVGRLAALLRLHDEGHARHVLATRGAETCAKLTNPKATSYAHHGASNKRQSLAEARARAARYLSTEDERSGGKGGEGGRGSRAGRVRPWSAGASCSARSVHSQEGCREGCRAGSDASFPIPKPWQPSAEAFTAVSAKETAKENGAANASDARPMVRHVQLLRIRAEVVAMSRGADDPRAPRARQVWAHGLSESKEWAKKYAGLSDLTLGAAPSGQVSTAHDGTLLAMDLTPHRLAPHQCSALALHGNSGPALAAMLRPFVFAPRRQWVNLAVPALDLGALKAGKFYSVSRRCDGHLSLLPIFRTVCAWRRR